MIIAHKLTFQILWIVFLFLLCPAQKIYAQTPAQLSVSGISNPSAANGTYIKTGTRGYVDGTGTLYDYWKHQTQNYYIYCDEYAGWGYWMIDLDLNDNNSNELFYSKGYQNSSGTNHDSPTIAASPNLVVWNNETPGTGTGNPSFGVLPVELISFTSSIINNSNVNLNWHTATEVNNYGFDVERRKVVESMSSGTGEQTQWLKIGFVNGAGTSNSPKSYSFTDANVSSGKYVYRLKQNDNDGIFKYSQEAEVSVAVPKEYALSQNYPNPFNPMTKIQYSIPKLSIVNLKIFDIMGREVTTLVSETMEAGSYEAVFNASKFASGIYFYRLQTGSFSSVKKLILMK
jgi:hypothetical protein